MAERETFYRNGEQVAYTGVTEEKYGGTWYEIEVVGDSHRIGTKLVTQRAPTPPAPTLRDAANAQRAEFERTGRVTVTGFEIEGR